MAHKEDLTPLFEGIEAGDVVYIKHRLVYRRGFSKVFMGEFWVAASVKRVTAKSFFIEDQPHNTRFKIYDGDCVGGHLIARKLGENKVPSNYWHHDNSYEIKHVTDQTEDYEAVKTKINLVNEFERLLDGYRIDIKQARAEDIIGLLDTLKQLQVTK